MISKSDYVDERVVWVVREKRAEETSWRLRGDAQARKLAVGLSSYQAGVGMRLVT